MATEDAKRFLTFRNLLKPGDDGEERMSIYLFIEENRWEIIPETRNKIMKHGSFRRGWSFTVIKRCQGLIAWTGKKVCPKKILPVSG